MKINPIQTYTFKGEKAKLKTEKQIKPIKRMNTTLNYEQVKLLYDALDCSRSLKKRMYDYKIGMSLTGGMDIENMYLYCKHLNYTLEQITKEIEGK